MAKRFLTPLNLPNLASNPETGAEGDLYFNTVDNVIKIYIDNEWTELQGGGASVIFQETQPNTSTLDVGDIWVEHVPTPPEPDPEPELVEIVSTNLVVNLDAGDSNSYPGTGTTWFNLEPEVGNATLVNGPVFNEAGAYFDFDGINDHATFADDDDVDFDGDFSLDIWFYLNVKTSLQGLLVHRDSDATLAGAWGINYTSTSDKIIFGNLFNPIVNTEIFTPSATTWYHLVIRRIGSTMKFFVNGVDSGVTRTDSYNYTISRPVLIGLWGTTSGEYPSGNLANLLNGRIGAIKMYKNLGLSDAQILQNYNALKDRYV
jgi:hypothetical protein